jgi:serine O-acetyltransferase
MRLWFFSPDRLWLLSIALQRRGHWRLAFSIKQVNTLLYHNSLGQGASVSPDIPLGHYSHGIVVTSNAVIGRRVKIWYNVTLSAGRTSRRCECGPSGPHSQIRIEDDVKIGTNAVVIAPRGSILRIGRGARIGAGAVVTHNVPAGATVVAPEARVLLSEATAGEQARRFHSPSGRCSVLTSGRRVMEALRRAAEEDEAMRAKQHARLPPCQSPLGSA